MISHFFFLLFVHNPYSKIGPTLSSPCVSFFLSVWFIVENMSRSSNKKRLVREMRKMEVQISMLQGTIKEEAKRFKSHVEHEKSLRVKKISDHSHHRSLIQDSHQRVSDRAFDIRSYSRMDVAIWQYPQVRDWFNAYASDVPRLNVRYVESGYTIEVNE